VNSDRIKQLKRAIASFKRRNTSKCRADNGRTVFAWRVPGTREHGSISMLEAELRRTCNPTGK